jgi:hypothetical protein
VARLVVPVGSPGVAATPVSVLLVLPVGSVAATATPVSMLVRVGSPVVAATPVSVLLALLQVVAPGVHGAWPRLDLAPLDLVRNQRMAGSRRWPQGPRATPWGR